VAANQLKKKTDTVLPFRFKNHLLIWKLGPTGWRSNEQYYTSALSHTWPVHTIQRESV